MPLIKWRRMAPIHGKHAVFTTVRMVSVRNLTQQLLERSALVCGVAHHVCIRLRISTVSTNDDIGCVALMDQELIKTEPLLLATAEI